MKTILVPTDFSKPARDAAIYALHIAKYLKSNLELCHAVLTPAETTVAGQVVWPLYNDELFLQNALDGISELASALTQISKVLNYPNNFKPIIEYTVEPAVTVQLVNRLAAKQQVGLVVAGMSGAGPVAKFFTGSTSSSLIEQGKFPILLVPSGCSFKPVNKIAFATDLNQKDIEVIHSLTGLARYFDAELVIVHIDRNPEKYDPKKPEAFLNDVTCKINYDKIYYREINSSNVNDGLQWLSQNGWIDMLVMVHRQNNFMNRLINGSFTKKQAGRIKIPLLVMPEGLNPVF